MTPVKFPEKSRNISSTGNLQRTFQFLLMIINDSFIPVNIIFYIIAYFHHVPVQFFIKFDLISIIFRFQRREGSG